MTPQPKTQPKTHAMSPAEFEARHFANLAGATGTILALARELQKAAFPPEHGGFQPAPVYLQQATTIAEDAFVQMRLGNLLWAIGEGLKGPPGAGEAPKEEA